MTRGYRVSEGLGLLHAEDRDDIMHIVVSTFVLIWRELRYWNILANVISLSVVRPVADFAYQRFARRRFDRLSHCQSSLKQERERDASRL